MKEFLQQCGFKTWGSPYLLEIGSKKIFIEFKPKNKKQIEFFEIGYNNAAHELVDFYSKFNELTYSWQGKVRNISEAKISILNEMFDNFKEEAIPYPEHLDISRYNDDFEMHDFYLKKEHPFFGKLYTKEQFENFNYKQDWQEANIIRRVKKIAFIFGYDDDIVIDLQSENDSGYQIYLLSGRSGTGQGLYPINLNFTEFIKYFLLFGFIGHWYIAFINKASFTKKQIWVTSLIKDLEKDFLDSPVHQEMLNVLVSNFSEFQ